MSYLFKIQSKSLGDTIVSLYAIDSFRILNKIENKIGVICHNFNHYILSYPMLKFYELINEPIWNDEEENWKINNDNFDNFQRIEFNFYEGLIEGVLRQLRITDNNILKEYPKIDYINYNLLEKDNKTITFSMHSTAQVKYWNYPDGWFKLIEYLKIEGYKVINVDFHKTFGSGNYMNTVPDNCIHKNNLPLGEVSKLICQSDFFIGISSGLSWLAHALQIPVVLISGMTKLNYEFKHNILRIGARSEFKECLNDRRFKFDPNNWAWYPVYSNTINEFICSKSINPEYVFDNIMEWILNGKKTKFI